MTIETKTMKTNPTLGTDLLGKHVIVRTCSAGVHAGILEARDGKEVLLSESRRIWYWSGAASLSELAQRGTRRPDACKFPAPVTQILLTEAIEIIPTTSESRASLDKVKPWTE